MSKSALYAQELTPVLDSFLAGGSAVPLRAYLETNSRLPGPRGNLELAEAFGDRVGVLAGADTVALWSLCTGMLQITDDEAPVNTPGEFVPFCGAVGLGALGAASVEQRSPALGRLRIAAKDPRWRMREAVCFGLQRMMAVAPDTVLEVLDSWVDAQDPLEMRAVVAAVADPPLLADARIAARALVLHRRVLEAVAVTPPSEHKIEPFRVLRKGLAFTLSVVVVSLPAEGFALLQELAASSDPDIRSIVHQNLKKKRLTSKFPDCVDAVALQLTQS